MQQEFWYVQCPRCSVTNRLRIKKTNHDQVDVTCPKCKTVFRTKIISKEELELLRNNLSKAIMEALSQSEKVTDAIQAIQKSWLDVELLIIGNVSALTEEGLHTTNPTLDDADVIFNKGDIDWAKKFKINLNK